MKNYLTGAVIKTLFILSTTSLFYSCLSMNPQKEGTRPPSHEDFTRLLQQVVDEKGNVDYQEVKKQMDVLKAYNETLSDNPPNDTWTEQDQLAYWINVYNAFTLQLVAENYPVESIKDIGSKFQIPFVNTPWDIKFVRIGDEMLDLNNVEHDILRKKFKEPRIHFAVNCASVSCPVLRNEAYEAAKLERQLTEQAQIFLQDLDKNDFSDPASPKLSKLFQWFKGDFTKNGSVIDFIFQNGGIRIDKSASINYLEYNWSLNEK